MDGKMKVTAEMLARLLPHSQRIGTTDHWCKVALECLMQAEQRLTRETHLPDPTKVDCPKCGHQFVAVPKSVLDAILKVKKAANEHPTSPDQGR